ncbi:hypothetical protein TcasGA2_TC031217 [Tribolium castaneum]|uniref:Uncharacterized protein n=1 Tax=Tribolium castaneum TaxID=7070 RepID=A0A139W8G6_TRICA|nr:hypothetical protein TcasGA2_TC031217 [Tribolium castaneum]
MFGLGRRISRAVFQQSGKDFLLRQEYHLVQWLYQCEIFYGVLYWFGPYYFRMARKQMHYNVFQFILTVSPDVVIN